MLYSIEEREENGSVIWILTLLYGLLTLKQCRPTYALDGPSDPVTEHRIVLIDTFSFGVTHVGAYGHHLKVEARVLWVSIDMTFHLYPSTP